MMYLILLPFFVGILFPSNGQASTPTDLRQTHWAYPYLNWAMEQKIMNGYEDGTIRPDQPVTEDAFLAMITRYFSNSQQDKEQIRQGLSSNSWWSDSYYMNAVKYNIPIRGNAMATAKQQVITRGTVAQVIAGTFGENYDVSGSIAFLFDQGLSEGKTSKSIRGYEAEGVLTRAEVATFLYRLNEKFPAKRNMDVRRGTVEHNPRTTVYLSNPSLARVVQTLSNIQTAKFYEIYLLEETPYYREVGDEKELATYYQENPIPVVERRGEWFSFQFGSGVRWFHLGSGTFYVRSIAEKNGADRTRAERYKFLHFPVTVYREANPLSERIMKLEPQRVEVLRINGNWHEVKTNLGNGWLYADPSIISDKLNVKAITVSDKLAMYTYPNPFLKPVGVYENVFTETVALAKVSNWYLVEQGGNYYWIQNRNNSIQEVNKAFTEKGTRATAGIGNATFTTDSSVQQVQQRIAANVRGSESDRLFDTFIARPVNYHNNNQFYHNVTSSDGNRGDLIEYVNTLFGDDNQIARLNEAARLANDVLRETKKTNIIIGLPYPVNRTGGTWTVEQSIQLERWYIDEALKRWNAMNPSHLSLLGFYWTHEAASNADIPLIRGVSSYIKQKGYQFFWAPYYGAQNAEKWKSLGFDFAWMQPNYYFAFERANHPGEDMLGESFTLARETGAGTMLEWNWSVANDGNGRYLEEYLDRGKAMNANRTSILVYDGEGATDVMLSQNNASIRPLQQKLFDYLSR